mmetsp:Transcript_11113/g.31451  ORF Transcript_11113/g.31451 Transcript_11113/m.31451 type:complete len:591 (+) Transcript_11113:181-1953(+)
MEQKDAPATAPPVAEEAPASASAAVEGIDAPKAVETAAPTAEPAVFPKETETEALAEPLLAVEPEKAAEQAAAIVDDASTAVKTAGVVDESMPASKLAPAGKKVPKAARSQRSASSSQAKSANLSTVNPASTDMASSPVAKRKRKHVKPAVHEEEDTVRLPRLSPEPEDDPEGAKRVREKNRLRMYRYHRNLEKRSNPQSEPTPVTKPFASKLSSKYHMAPREAPAPTPVKKVKPPTVSVPTPEPEEVPGSPPPRPPSPSKASRDPPRLSPVPENASHEEQKRIKAKNRLRLYRFNNGQIIKEKRSKKRTSSSGSEEAGGDYEELAHRGCRHGDSGDTFSASAYSNFAGMDSSALAAMIAAAASAQGGNMGFPSNMSDMAHMMSSHRSGMITPRSSESGHMELPISPARSPKPRKTPKAPAGPPRLSPEPEDPVEAKRVRSKNRVRMHRYNQSLAAAQQAAESNKHESFGQSGAAKLSGFGAPFPGHGSLMGAAFGRNLPSMMGAAVSDPISEVYRQVLGGSGMMPRVPSRSVLTSLALPVTITCRFHCYPRSVSSDPSAIFAQLIRWPCRAFSQANSAALWQAPIRHRP